MNIELIYTRCYYESLNWIKHKLENGVISNEEYLKELLMIKNGNFLSDFFNFDSSGKLIGIKSLTTKSTSRMINKNELRKIIK